MRMLLKGAAIALTLAGTTFATVGTSDAAGFAISTSDRGRDHANVSFNMGDVAYGYRDGYWDNGHRWHNWRNGNDHRDYRDQHGDNYRNGYHHRYRDRGWMGGDRSAVGVAFSFDDIAFGYQDGYWDNNHSWHNWRNRSDHDGYRNHQGNNYRSGNHNRYRGQGWHRN